MPVITCRITADDGPDQYLEDLSSEWWNLQREDRDTDLILVSGEDVSRVHQAVLLPLSPFLENLVPAVSCSCFTPTVILPSVQKDSLAALVELFYTGRTVVGSETAENEVVELIAILQIGVKGQDEEKKDTFDQNRQSERIALEKIDGSVHVESDESVDKVEISKPANKEVDASQLLTEVSDQIENNNDIEGQELTDLLTKTTRTRGQKRKIGEILNENNKDIPKHKKKRVDCRLNLDPCYVLKLTNNNVINRNVDLAPDLIEGYNDDNTDQHNIPDQTDFTAMGTISNMDASDAIGERNCENKLNQSAEKSIQSICPFCSKEFEREIHFKKHLSWYHFREEICEKFNGLDCAICRKSFVRKSDYVGHLGSAHKIIDSLMDLLFDDKMAQIREYNQPKALNYIKQNENDFIKDDRKSSKISHMSKEGATRPVSLSATEADENETTVAVRSDKGKQEYKI